MTKFNATWISMCIFYITCLTLARECNELWGVRRALLLMVIQYRQSARRRWRTAVDGNGKLLIAVRSSSSSPSSVVCYREKLIADFSTHST